MILSKKLTHNFLDFVNKAGSHEQIAIMRVRGVMVAREILILFVGVRVPTGLPHDCSNNFLCHPLTNAFLPCYCSAAFS